MKKKWFRMSCLKINLYFLIFPMTSCLLVLQNFGQTWKKSWTHWKLSFSYTEFAGNSMVHLDKFFNLGKKVTSENMQVFWPKGTIFVHLFCRSLRVPFQKAEQIIRTFENIFKYFEVICFINVKLILTLSRCHL